MKVFSEPKKGRHSLSREPPLPIYLGLKVHSVNRSKKLIDELCSLGISISYDRVLQLENNIAFTMCKQFESDGIVCPSILRKGLVTIGAIDNIDHNPSSATAHSSFHGTGISITQFPTLDAMGDGRELVQFTGGATESCGSLPLSYSTVPAVSLDASKASVPEKNYTISDVDLDRCMVKEDAWLKQVLDLLESDSNEPISWAAFHAACTVTTPDLPAVTTMLPLFPDKADTPAIIKHSMTIPQSLTQHLNPGQIPVMACDCPIFAKAKYIQWTWPSTHGEDKLVIMFGGLHLEMSMWNVLGDYLTDSGWTVALSEAGIASSGIAESFLKVSHLTRTRHAHQITIAALYKLQKEAYSLSDVQNISYEQWRLDMIKKSPTFQFWDTVMSIEKIILTFIRAHREKIFDLYVKSLELIVGFFFALDHYNYARWVPIHIRDMKSLPTYIEESFKDYWVVAKTSNRFSYILWTKYMSKRMPS